jgi:hypothetical protein
MFGGISFESESESIEKFKQRVPKMSDEELITQGKMLRDLCNGRTLGYSIHPTAVTRLLRDRLLKKNARQSKTSNSKRRDS